LKTSIYHYFAIVVIALAGIIYIAANCYARKNLEHEVEALKSELAACQNTVKIDSELRRIDVERIRQVNTRLEKIHASETKICEDIGALDGAGGELDAGVRDVAVGAYDRLVCGAVGDAVPST
jgi:hypothetical protein